jgi:tetratricopeptide (TPR) repeat protein/DNA-binding SARP family transcriptional activator
MELPSPTVGGLLRRYRGRAGLTQQELARAAGVSVRALRDLEQGRVGHPRSRSVAQLAVGLGLDEADRHRLLAAVDAAAAGDGRLQVGVLGPLVVRRGEVSVDVAQPKLRYLLGLLGLQAGQMVPRGEIIDALWGERPPATCVELVHTYVAWLRRVLEPGRRRRAPGQTLVSVRGGYLLVADAEQLDVLRFDDLAGRALRARAVGDLAAACGLLAQALGQWRGPVLADLGPRLGQHPAAVALSQRHIGAALAYADLAIALGRLAELVVPLQALCRQEPLHEGLHARLMLALAGRGQQATALQLFGELRGRLADELGVEPGAEIQDAHLRVLRQQLPAEAPMAVSAGWDVSAPTAATPPAAAIPAQLPPDVAAFTGRTDQLGQLDRLLEVGAGTTAVVISAIGGTAGVGKTALALHWAHRVRDQFPDGQLYVDLRGAAVAPAVGSLEALASFLCALGVPAERVPVELEQASGLYRTLLADKRLLVVLDNAGSAEQVRPLLPASPGCLVLVTSRDRLGGLIAREGAVRLSLDVLTPEEASGLLTRLLDERRVMMEPAATAELGRLCAGLPLALRIAAANLISQPQSSIARYVAELDEGNRLAALEADEDEQAAVRAAFDLSYAALPSQARRVFRLLGLVPGPDFTPEATAALAGTTWQQVRRLLDRLTRAHLISQPTPGRFALHDLLRLYAAERARDDDNEFELEAAYHRLLDWYLHTVDAAARLLYPRKMRLALPCAGECAPAATFDDHIQALSWLEAERPNLVAATVHAAQHGPRPAGWALADALRGYFFLQVHAVDWLAVAGAGLAAAQEDGDRAAQVAGQLSLADAHARQSQYRQADQLYTSALALARQIGWLDAQSTCLSNLAYVDFGLGRLQAAADHLTEALGIDRQLGRLDRQAAKIDNLGRVYKELGWLERAADYHDQARTLEREVGYSTDAANLGNLGEACHALGRLDQALDHLTHALTLYRETGDRWGEAQMLRWLAAVHRDAGRHTQALELAHALMALAPDIGDPLVEVDAQNTLAIVSHRLGHHQQAVDHHQQALVLARETGNRLPEVGALVGLAAAHQGLGHADQAMACARQAVALSCQIGYRLLEGQALTTLADIHLQQDEPGQAIHHAGNALALHRQTGHRLGEARTLLVAGHALCRIGDTDAALSHWQEALALFSDIGTTDADHVRDLLHTHSRSQRQPLARDELQGRPARDADHHPDDRRYAVRPDGRPELA